MNRFIRFNCFNWFNCFSYFNFFNYFNRFIRFNFFNYSSSSDRFWSERGWVSLNGIDAITSSRAVSKASWLEELGFVDNPFYLDPVRPDDNSISKGFIDREKEQQLVESYAELKRYRLLILGRVGEGKSSVLNLFLNRGRKLGKNIVVLDGLKVSNREGFIETLLTSLQGIIHQMPEHEAKLLDDRLTKLGVVSKKKLKSQEVGSEVGAKFSAIVAAISGKLTAKESTSEETEYYIPPRIKQLEAIYNELLPHIFDSASFMLLLDNLEGGFSEISREHLLDEVIQTIPNSVLLVATANHEILTERSLRSKIPTIFDGFLHMEKVDREKLETFVNRRMGNYAKHGKPKIAISKEAMDLIYDFTEGNLRDSFQLCFQALMKHKCNIDAKMIQEEIDQKCSLLLGGLGDTEKSVLHLLADSDGLTVNQIHSRLKKPSMVSSRALYNVCLSLERERIIRGRQHRVQKKRPTIVYYLPKSMKGRCLTLA